MTVEDVLAFRSVSAPAISPDGRWVAYVVTGMDFENNVNDSDIWVVRTEGGDPQRLTHLSGVEESPQWAPDSSFILFASDRREDAERQLYGIRPDGGEAWPVTDWATGVGAFHLSPDGARLGFVANAPTDAEQEAFETLRGRPIVWGEPYPDEWAHLWIAPMEHERAGEATRVSPDAMFVSAFVWNPELERSREVTRVCLEKLTRVKSEESSGSKCVLKRVRLMDGPSWKWQAPVSILSEVVPL